MMVSFSGPLVYPVRNASVVSASTNDGFTETVSFRPDLYDNYIYTILLLDAYGDVQITETFPHNDFYNTDYGHLTGFSNGGAFTVQIDAGTGTYNGVTSPRTSLNYELVFTNALVTTGSLTLYQDDRGGPFVPPPASLSIVGDSYTTAQNPTSPSRSRPACWPTTRDASGGSLTAMLSGNLAHGAITLNGDGSFIYSPTSGYSGPDSFTYLAGDASGQSGVATVSLTVTAVSPTVTAAADSYTTAQGTPLTVASSSGLLANDTDTDSGLLTAVLVGNPAHGALTLNRNGSFSYTPAAGYSGSDAFTYRAIDGTVQSTTTTVSLTVTPVINPATATDDSYTTPQGTPLTVAASAGVLANDTDPDGRPLTAVLVGSPAHGTLTLNSDGSFTYGAAPGHRGSDAFIYRASDGAVQSATATVSLTITAVDHPVVATADSYAVSNASPSADFITSVVTGVLKLMCLNRSGETLATSVSLMLQPSWVSWSMAAWM